MTERSSTPRSPSGLLDEAHALAAASMAELMDLSATAAVVTGGARGIGAAVALRLGSLGAAVTLVDADDAVIESADSLSERLGAPVRGEVFDVRDAPSLRSVADDVAATAARLVWVNAAGVFPTHALDALDERVWADVVGIDLDGTFHGARAAALAARRHGIPGVIVNISSTAGSRAGWPAGITHYVAAKHGVEGLTKALAVELGADDIRVMCVAPATVVTEGLIERFGEADGTDQDVYLRATRRLPIRRPSLPDDVARVVAFVASPAAAMMTGSVVMVDGGHLAT